MVNKRDVEMSIVYLSCYFDVGYFPCHRARGTLLAFLMIYVCLQWQELAWDLSRLALFKYLCSLDMRFSTYDLSSICLIFVLALSLTTQDAYDGGNESSNLVSTIIFGRFIKTCNHCFPLRRAFLLLFMLSLHLLPLCTF
jgi:hypothetical protein